GSGRGRAAGEGPQDQEGPDLSLGQGDGREARVRHAAAGWRTSEGSFPPSASGEPVMDYSPFPLVDLSGSPRERGRQHGQAVPEASADGTLRHGRNWDWRAECAETGVVLRIRRDDGPDILTFAEAGGLARSGLNSAGIGLTANALECDRDYQRGHGVPLPFIRRKVLESAYLAQAVRTIFATPKLGSNHMAVSHARIEGGGGEAFGFECAPDETFWVAPERGIYVHANHWIAESARAKVKDTGLQETPCSIYRDKR